MLLDRRENMEVAVLVHIDSACGKESEAVQEFVDLVRSANIFSTGVIRVSERGSLNPKFLMGSGKVQELACHVRACKADVVVVNARLTPSQERNLERALSCRVVDRTGLILDVFAQRARTYEGKLQVELAQLNHLSTRLVRGWTHLERQKGGIGLRGPGETQLETDRRLIRQRVLYINKRLDKVRGQRQQGRRARQKAGVCQVAIVGYTNAGKSTLFNCLTKASIYTADKLFATLDPTLRRIHLLGMGETVLSDTVGFVRQLPHKLVDAFRATLEEVTQANLLIHVIDGASPSKMESYLEVTKVLEEIGAAHIPRFEVVNKIDQLNNFAPRIDRNHEGKAERVWLSAKTGHGLALLQEALEEWLSCHRQLYQLTLRASDAKLRAQLYARGVIIGERQDEQGDCHLRVRLLPFEFERLVKKNKVVFSRRES